jgi:hypothetical protein
VKSIIPVILLLAISGASMAGDIEEPEWQLVDTLDSVELRHYSPSIQARTTLDGSGQTSVGFKRLAGFIFGGNDRSQSIAMTAPVQETLQDSVPTMAFTMPGEYALDDLPAPEDDRVVIVDVPERTLAVIRFSGWATRGKIASNSRKLLETLEDNGIEPVSGTTLNQYNPPWTPPFLRRNEISVEIPAIVLASSE